MPAQFYSGIYPLLLRAVPTVHYETYIRDHSEQILAVLRIQFHGFVIIGSQ